MSGDLGQHRQVVSTALENVRGEDISCVGDGEVIGFSGKIGSAGVGREGCLVGYRIFLLFVFLISL